MASTSLHWPCRPWCESPGGWAHLLSMMALHFLSPDCCSTRTTALFKILMFCFNSLAHLTLLAFCRLLLSSLRLFPQLFEFTLMSPRTSFYVERTYVSNDCAGGCAPEGSSCAVPGDVRGSRRCVRGHGKQKSPLHGLRPHAQA